MVIERLEKKSEARAALGQDVAGGDGRPIIRREQIYSQFDNWWATKNNEPIVLIGSEGVGKTFNTLAWIIDNFSKLPIPIIFSSGVFVGKNVGSERGVMDIIASHFLEITNIRNVEYWRVRLQRYLSRDVSGQPGFLVFIDGLNQEPNVN